MEAENDTLKRGNHLNQNPPLFSNFSILDFGSVSEVSILTKPLAVIHQNATNLSTRPRLKRIVPPVRNMRGTWKNPRKQIRIPSTWNPCWRIAAPRTGSVFFSCPQSEEMRNKETKKLVVSWFLWWWANGMNTTFTLREIWVWWQATMFFSFWSKW